MAVWTALALCKCVAIAGFGSGCDADGPGPTDVYYKTGDIGSKSLYAFHDMHSEWAWLRELARNGVIEWLGCQFNSSDSGSQPDLKEPKLGAFSNPLSDAL
jgi:hypothetical protein